MILQRKHKTIILLVALVVILFGTTAYITLKVHHDRKEKQESIAGKKMYVCSMEPQIIRDKPGFCPICGMALIEKKDFEENYADPRLNDVVKPVNETVLASVQTISPVRTELPQTIEASGIINYDSRNVKTVSANFRGLIEHSYIKYRYQPIIKGQKIYDIYCPEIYSTHINYINLVKKYPDQPEMTFDAMNWLIQLGLTDEQIDQIKYGEKPDYHLTVYSNVEGFAVGPDFDPENALVFDEDQDSPAASPTTGNRGIGLTEGVIIEAGQPLFKVISKGSVRADLKIRNEDAAYLRPGQKVVLTDVVSPGKKLTAIVNQIEPLNSGVFQLVKVYITDNNNLLLPGMKIQAYIEAGIHNSLWVPKSAVADLGLNHAVFLLQDSVFVATGVTTGFHSGDKIEIRSGIDGNSVIATNASLLTDSDGFIITASR
jgi:membrane fusion protein, copper/silver efflux system